MAFGMRRVDFTMAASGKVLGTLHLVDEEFRCDTEVLSTTFNRHMHHLVVVMDATSSPLNGHRIVTEGDTEVQLIAKDIELINAWFLCSTQGEFIGNRKWYKAFRSFAAFWPLSIPQMCSIKQSYPPRFCGVAIRTLAPLILQVIVADARHDTDGHGWLKVFRQPDGCVHSIVRRTNAPLRLVEKFVREFERANQVVIALIYREVARNPFRNYFS